LSATKRPGRVVVSGVLAVVVLDVGVVDVVVDVAVELVMNTLTNKQCHSCV